MNKFKFYAENRGQNYILLDFLKIISGVDPADCGETTTTTATPEPELGVIIVGGYARGGQSLASVETFPENNLCDIPDLPSDGRRRHTLSLLEPEDNSAQTLVVCGGDDTSDSCLSWRSGETSYHWTHS